MNNPAMHVDQRARGAAKAARHALSTNHLPASAWTKFLRRAVMDDTLTVAVFGGRLPVSTQILGGVISGIDQAKSVALGRACLAGDKDAVFAIIHTATADRIAQYADYFALAPDAAASCMTLATASALEEIADIPAILRRQAFL